MKTIKRLLMPAALCLILCGCQESPQPETGPDPETAMENFLAKVEAGNYIMNAEDYLVTTVSSRDQVAFEYVEDIYNDFVAMSINNEAFQGFLEEDGLREVAFLGEGQAVDAAKRRLLNYWLDDSVSDGNIWNLFYNVPDEPLKFMSHEDAVKQSLLTFVGYNENALRLMQDVYLILDKEDPDTAHLQAVVDDDVVARVYYDDIDLEITFGNAVSNPLADEWMNNPVYPAARTGWTEGDEFVFNSVFLPGYGLDAVPFPPFASYALAIDQENFVWEDTVRMRDSHASEENLAEYIEILKKNGFSEIKETAEDGTEQISYRKLLREAYKCWSSIHVDYDNGFNLTAEKYYDFPVYDDPAAINDAIGRIGYPALPETENFTAYHATDRAVEMTESWLYFFDYDLGLYVDIDFSDREGTEAYLKAYEETLADAGFHPVKADDEEEADYYESENGFYSFRYQFLDEGKVSLLFKSEKYITAAEAEKMITDAGFPAIDLTEPISVRDLKLFRKVRNGQDLKAFITVSQTFESAEKAEEFLNAYEEELNNAGFDRTNPELVGSLKQIAIYNEEKGMYVGLDYFAEQAMVNFDFYAE
ncbi:MAG: hypothetical protein IJJ24_07865 [Solobacterium sp.]|nr:hypothetical protein [Solobacterium sp.]